MPTQSDNMEEEIKEMKLYTHMDRVRTEVRAVEEALGLAPNSKALACEEVQGFTCLNYTGVSGVDNAAGTLGLCARQDTESPEKVLLDIGCGLCGPARHLVSHYRCTVVGVELQGELADASAWLNERCGISGERISIVKGKAESEQTLVTLQEANKGAQYDGAYSLLTLGSPAEEGREFRHSLARNKLGPLRSLVFASGLCCIPRGLFCEGEIHRRGGPECKAKYPGSRSPDEGGVVFVTGLFGVYRVLAEHVTETELSVLDTQVYIDDLAKAGFLIDDGGWVDKTSEWAKFVSARLEGFVSGKAAYIAKHGEATYNDLLQFYSAVHWSFQRKGLGGAMITAVRQGSAVPGRSCNVPSGGRKHASRRVPPTAHVFHTTRAPALPPGRPPSLRAGPAVGRHDRTPPPTPPKSATLQRQIHSGSLGRPRPTARARPA
eukprot:scaffold3410_cov398-Prasinococcus_capsulatus_cf.AAC.8